MSKVTTVNIPHVCEFEIHISIKTGRFDVRPMDAAVAAKIASVHKFQGTNTFWEAMEQVKEQAEVYRTNFQFNRKVIVVQLQTSVSDHTKIDKWPGMGERIETPDKLTGGEGFTIKWYVAEEFKTEFRGKPVLLYRIIESSLTGKVENGQIHNIYQVTTGSGEPRVINYSDDLYDWLKDLQNKVKSMLEKLNTFFDPDPVKFLENFNNAPLQLGAGEPNQ